MTSKDHQQSLSCYCSNTVEGATDANEQRLLMIAQSMHIEAVSSNIMRCRSEGHQPEGCQGELEE